jgi:O-succinylbenzoic acid--CoA ligase
VGGVALVSPFGHGLGKFMEATRPSVASLVPTMVHRLTASDPDTLAAVGTVLTGGAALQPGLARRAHDLGITLLPTYGMTEASSQIATPQSGTVANHTGFVGPPLRGFDVRTTSADSARPGRIVIDGPAVFDGYLGEVERTGSFETNDVGFFDAEGCLTVLGRVDDVVVSGGENVSLSLVESVLVGLDAVDEASVVGIPDAEWGTMVCALVVTTSDLSAIREAASVDLGPHEIPKSWARMDAVPLLENGKRDLNAIRAHFPHG